MTEEERRLLLRCVWTVQWMLSHFADPPQFGPVLPQDDVREQLAILGTAIEALKPPFPGEARPEG